MSIKEQKKDEPVSENKESVRMNNRYVSYEYKIITEEFSGIKFFYYSIIAFGMIV
jgi:hypothetical protein